MSATREMLEGEAYWGRIRLIKRKLYLLEAVLFGILAVVLVFTSGQFQNNPFYIPIDMLLWFILIMFLVVEVEGFVFRVMQIHIAKSDSTKHLMTHNSIRKAVVIAIAAAIVAIIFLTPAIVQSMESAFSYRGTVSPDSPREFLPGDPLGLSRAVSITLHSNLGTDAYIVTQYSYDQNQGDWSLLKANHINNRTLVDFDLTVDLPSAGYSNMYLFVDANGTAGELTTVDFTLNTKLSTTLTSFVPLIALAFVLSNAAWVAYLFPLGRKYAKGSIYK